jgi:ribosomal protein S6
MFRWKVNKFEDFLTTREPTMVSKDWGLKKMKFKTKKKGFYHLFEFNVQEKF